MNQRLSRSHLLNVFQQCLVYRVWQLESHPFHLPTKFSPSTVKIEQHEINKLIWKSIHRSNQKTGILLAQWLVLTKNNFLKFSATDPLVCKSILQRRMRFPFTDLLWFTLSQMRQISVFHQFRAYTTSFNLPLWTKRGEGF